MRHSQQNLKFQGRPVNLLWAQCDGTIADEHIGSTKVAFCVSKSGNLTTLDSCRILLATAIVPSYNTISNYH